MKTCHWLWVPVLATLVLANGCQQSATTGQAKSTGGATAQEYDIKAKVVSVAADKKSVNLDHEAIPALDMMAMKMDFRVENPKVLEGIKSGDAVKGRLKQTADGLVVTSLQKQ
jgi:Cu/Ag efflux protein CusF